MNNQVREIENIIEGAGYIQMERLICQKEKEEQPVSEDDQCKLLLFPPSKLQQTS